jgi:hypothetical protein
MKAQQAITSQPPVSATRLGRDVIGLILTSESSAKIRSVAPISQISQTARIF